MSDTHSNTPNPFLFTPNATFPGVRSPPDTILHSSDQVFFYVHRDVLLSSSSNNFDLNLPSSVSTTIDGVGDVQVVSVPEHSSIVNLLLLQVYSLPCIDHSPDRDTIQATVAALRTYGFAPPPPTSDIWTCLIQLAPSDPIPAFTIAASCGVEPVCVTLSRFTLGTSLLLDVSDEDVQVMGVIYFKRLLGLHQGRQQFLRRLLLDVPQEHPETNQCRIIRQQRLIESWCDACSRLLIKDAHGITSEDFVQELQPVVNTTDCDQCRTNVEQLTQVFIQKWDGAPCTI